MRSAIRMAAASGIAALIAAVTAACGPGSAGAHPAGQSSAAAGQSATAQALQAAYRSTTGEKTVAFRLNETINGAKTGGAPAQNAVINGSGQADLASKAFTMTTNLPTGGSLTTVESGGIDYVQVPAAQRSEIPGGKPWISVNLNKVTQAMLGTSFSQLTTGDANPADALQQLTALSSGVTKAGKATVAGVPATEYRAQVSVAKLASQMQAKAGPQAGQMIRQQERKLGSSLPVQVWVDANNLVRQVRSQAALPAASNGSGGAGTATSTLTFTSFGAPVNVTPPPASQVTDMTSQALQRAKAQG